METKTKTKSFNFKATVSLDTERLFGLLCSAFEGGSNYWITLVDTKLTNEEIKQKRTEKPDYSWIYDAVLYEGGSVLIHVDMNEDGNVKIHELTLDKFIKGVQRLFDTYPHEAKAILEEQDDANTGDIALQLALFDEVVFG